MPVETLKKILADYMDLTLNIDKYLVKDATLTLEKGEQTVGGPAIVQTLRAMGFSSDPDKEVFVDTKEKISILNTYGRLGSKAATVIARMEDGKILQLLGKFQ